MEHMAVDSLDRLLELQEYDRRLSSIRGKLAALPAMKEKARAVLEQKRKEVQELREKVKKSTLHIRQMEGDIEELHKKVARLRQQQMQVKSNEEYRTLGKEIEQVEEQISLAEDRELQEMEAAEQAEKDVQRGARELEAAEQEYQSDMRMLQQREDELRAQQSEAERWRREIAAEIAPDLLQLYERIMEHVGDYAVVPVENGNCGGCHMKLPTQVIYDVRKGLRIQTCTYCGRILYWRPE